MPCHLLTLLYVSAILSRNFSMYTPVPGCCPKHHQFNCVRNAMRSCTRKGRRRGTGWKTPMWCFRTMFWRIVSPNMILDALSRQVSKRSKQESGCKLDTFFYHSRLPLGNTYYRNSAKHGQTCSAFKLKVEHFCLENLRQDTESKRRAEQERCIHC